MKLRLPVLGLGLLAQAVMFAAPVAVAQDATTQTRPDVANEPSLARKAVEWSRDRLGELDAAILVAERETARLQGEARAKAEEALATLRARRDAYRAQADDAVTNAKTWTDAQVAAARQALDEKWVAFQTARDEYLDAAKADLATRRAILEAELDARYQAWRKSVEDLRAEASRLAADQRKAIDARIAALNAKIDETKSRIGKLQDASVETWNTTKKSYADTQKIIFDSYVSIRKTIEDATK